MNEGWLVMGSELRRREHYIRDGAALCGTPYASVRLDERRLERLSQMPPANACGTCLVRFSLGFEA